VRLPPDDVSDAEEDPSSTVSRAEIHVYLRLAATQRRIYVLVTAFVAAEAPKSVKDDIVDW